MKDTTIEKWVGELIQLVSDGMIERLGLEPDGHKTWATTTDEIVKELSEELTEHLPQALQQAREEMAREIFEMVSRISIGEEYEPIVKDKSNQTQYAGYLRCRDLIKYLIKRDFLSDLLTKEEK